MAASPYPPAKDPEKVPDPIFREPDYNEPIDDPESGELPEGEPDEDEDGDTSDDEPLRA
jgi:hypothetical protein